MTLTSRHSRAPIMAAARSVAADATIAITSSMVATTAEPGTRAPSGATTIDQYLAAGLVDELRLHIVPLTLGRGHTAVRRRAAAEAGAGDVAGGERGRAHDLPRAALTPLDGARPLRYGHGIVGRLRAGFRHGMSDR